MLWLQNIVIISVSFLLSRILIEADAHRYFIAYLLKKGYKQISDLITAVLLLSYLMSLFFSNTVVVLSLIAIINYFLDEIKDKLIYKANLGLSHGPIFGKGGEGFQRMNLAAPRATVLKALEQELKESVAEADRDWEEGNTVTLWPRKE